jgi:putative SOS response-associated peptidase YedK
MCANYAPSRTDLLAALTSLDIAFGFPDKVFPGQIAPIIRINDDGLIDCAPSTFGLIPGWAKEPKFSRFTYNARIETVDSKPSFRQAWQKKQWCAVPMQSFFEPYYGNGVITKVAEKQRAQWWQIDRKDQAIFFAAGIWDSRTTADHYMALSHTLLTINADGHPLMQRFHKPDEEKRSIVTMDFSQAMDWMASQNDSVARAQLVALDHTLFQGRATLPISDLTQPTKTLKAQQASLFDESPDR